jgi:hypothetical protein
MLDAQHIAAAIDLALRNESASLYRPYNPANHRAYGCAIAGCQNNAYAKGLCNAHYLRKRLGKDMATPLRQTSADKKCRECAKPLNGKGGWGLCANHYRQRRRRVIRETCVNLLGGCCQHCGGVFPLPVYDFHHTDSRTKDFAISDVFESKSVADLARELVKCQLVCANCHRIEHYERKL